MNCQQCDNVTKLENLKTGQIPKQILENLKSSNIKATEK